MRGILSTSSFTTCRELGGVDVSAMWRRSWLCQRAAAGCPLGDPDTCALAVKRAHGLLIHASGFTVG